MDINDIYGSISTFWNNISPILFAHLIAFLAIRWTVGSHLNTIERVKGYLATNKYKEWRGVIDEFELRPKLPYVFVIIFLVYLTLFNSLLLQSLDFHPITITYAEMEFWDENRPLDQILEVGTFGKNPNIRIWEINYLKQNFLQEFQAKHPDQYRSSVSWLSDLYGKWFTYYKCSILFLVFTIVLAWIHLRKRKNRSPRSLRRIFALLLFSAAAIGFTRYQAEKYIEKRLLAELSFVGTQVHVDDEAQKNRLDESQIRELRQHLCDELRSAGSRHDQLFWWSRVLERFSLVKRPFSVVSDEDFQRRYGITKPD